MLQLGITSEMHFTVLKHKRKVFSHDAPACNYSPKISWAVEAEQIRNISKRSAPISAHV
jgi:hypothetical protein